MDNPILEHIQWLGHAGFAICAHGKTLVIDPFRTNLGNKVDVILVTHSHHDHCSLDDIAKLRGKQTIIITEPQSAAKLKGEGEDDVRVVAPGDRLEAHGFDIEVVPAYNTNKSFHPKGNQWLGFIVTAAGKRFYHTGDSDVIPEMDHIRADVVMVPVSGTYVMTADEAVEAVKKIKPELALPMHYDAIVGTRADAERFRKNLVGICRVALLDSI